MQKTNRALTNLPKWFTTHPSSARLLEVILSNGDAAEVLWRENENARCIFIDAYNEATSVYDSADEILKEMNDNAYDYDPDEIDLFYVLDFDNQCVKTAKLNIVLRN